MFTIDLNIQKPKRLCVMLHIRILTQNMNQNGKQLFPYVHVFIIWLFRKITDLWATQNRVKITQSFQILLLSTVSFGLPLYVARNQTRYESCET